MLGGKERDENRREEKETTRRQSGNKVADGDKKYSGQANLATAGSGMNP
jgi:hypothetical protein